MNIAESALLRHRYSSKIASAIERVRAETFHGATYLGPNPYTILRGGLAQLEATMPPKQYQVIMKRSSNRLNALLDADMSAEKAGKDKLAKNGDAASLLVRRDRSHGDMRDLSLIKCFANGHR